MTKQIVNDVVHFIVTHCGEKKNVNLKWFGGEPTLGEHQIDRICEELSKYNIKYSSSMISNAYLFSPEMVQKAKNKWRLKNIQVTLDGTEAIYNKAKNYDNAVDNPYFRVLDNINSLLKENIYVNVRMNLDFHNIDDLSMLIEELANRFAGKKNFSAYVAPIFDDQGYVPIKHNQDDLILLADSAVALNRLIQERDCNRSSSFSQYSGLPSLRIYYCMADNPTSIQINPLGGLGKCEHALFSHLVGDLKSGIHYSDSNKSYWLQPSYLNECKLCCLYPVCGIINTCEATIPCVPKQIKERITDIKLVVINNYHRTQETFLKNRRS